jgi:hypothetical protein
MLRDIFFLFQRTFHSLLRLVHTFLKAFVQKNQFCCHITSDCLKWKHNKLAFVGFSWIFLWDATQSRQSAKLFLQSGLPQPLTPWRVRPPPLVPGVGQTRLAREGLEVSQFRRGDRHCGTLYILYMYFVGSQLTVVMCGAGYQQGLPDIP